MRWLRVALFVPAILTDLLFVTPVLGPAQCTRAHAPSLDFGPPPHER